MRVLASKLAPRFIKTYPIVKVISPAAVQLRLPHSFCCVHPVFQVSRVKPILWSPPIPLLFIVYSLLISPLYILFRLLCFLSVCFVPLMFTRASLLVLSRLLVLSVGLVFVLHTSLPSAQLVLWFQFCQNGLPILVLTLSLIIGSGQCIISWC